MNHHAYIDERRRKQVGDRNRVECNSDALGNTVGPNKLVANLAAGIEDATTYLVAEISCEETRIQRRESFSLGFKNIPQASFELADIGAALAFDRRLVAPIQPRV